MMNTAPRPVTRNKSHTAPLSPELITRVRMLTIELGVYGAARYLGVAVHTLRALISDVGRHWPRTIELVTARLPPPLLGIDLSGASIADAVAPGQPMTSSEIYLEARLNAAVAELESRTAERDAARLKLAEAERTIAVLEEQRRPRVINYVTAETHRHVNARLDALDHDEVAPTLRELVSDNTVFYSDTDLRVLEGFAAGLELCLCRAVPSPRSVRLLRTSIVNARQEIANMRKEER